MKKIYIALLCAFLPCICMMAQQSTQMQIKLKTGQTVQYDTNDVERITFAEEDQPEVPFAVTINLKELTSTFFKVAISPSDDTKYYASIWTSDFMSNSDGSWLPDDMLIETCIPDPDFDSKCHTGACELSMENCLPGSRYVVIVFDADAKTGKAVEVFKYGVRLNEGLNPDPQFMLSNQEVGFTDVSFHATANDPDGFVIARVLEKVYFEKYGETVVQNLYYMLQNAAVDRRMSLSEYVNQNGAYGERDFYFDNLKPGTEYVAAVFYVNPTNNDPTAVYDWNYTRWDFTTKEATSAPLLEVTNLKKTKNMDGTVNLSFHAKATNATTVIYGCREASDVEQYSSEDPETWSDLYIGFARLQSSELESINSPEGLDKTIQGLDDKDWYLLLRAKDSEGGTKTCVVKAE